jgi:hypothetical protein
MPKRCMLVTCIALVAMCVGCDTRSLSISRPYALDMTPPPGPPSFQQGYRDGCETGIAGFGSQFNKLHYHMKYDTSLYDDVAYNRVWNAASRYCALFVSIAEMHYSDPAFQHEPW